MGAEEHAFQRLWGPWDVPSPAQAATLLDGFPKPWWISGGWAIDAFSGGSRPHKDTAVTIFGRDVDVLREHFRGRFDLWAAGSGMLRPLDDRRPRPPRWSQQVWLREHALARWVLNVQLNPGGPRRWVFKRDHSVRMLLDEATWVDVDGLRYLRPELVLAHKVLLRRPTDDDDLAAVLPRLDPSARSWLHDYVVRRTPLIRGATRCDRPYGLDSSPPDQRRHGGREGRARHYPAPRREKSVRAG